MILASTIWVYKNSKKENAKYPGLWASLIFLFWIPLFPIYLFKRFIDKTNLNQTYKKSLLYVAILGGIAITIHLAYKNLKPELREYIKYKLSKDSEYSNVHQDLSSKIYQLQSEGKYQDEAVRKAENALLINAKNSIVHTISRPYEKLRVNLMIEHLEHILGWCIKKRNLAVCGEDDYLDSTYLFLEKNFVNDQEQLGRFIPLQVNFARYYRHTERPEKAMLILHSVLEKTESSSCDYNRTSALSEVIYLLKNVTQKNDLSKYEKLLEECNDKISLQRKKQEK